MVSISMKTNTLYSGLVANSKAVNFPIPLEHPVINTTIVMMLQFAVVCDNVR